MLVSSKDFIFRQREPNEILNPSLSDPQFITYKTIKKSLSSALQSIKIKKNSYILDIGCGNNPYVKLFLQSQPQIKYIGLDIKKSHLADVICDASKLPFKENSFDVVISTQVFCHVDSPRTAFKEIYDILKKRGVFITTLPCVWFVYYSHDFYRWTKYGLYNDVRAGGFKKIQVNEIGGTFSTVFQILIFALHNFIFRKLGRPFSILLQMLVTPFLNLLAMAFDSCIKDSHLPLNYILISEK